MGIDSGTENGIFYKAQDYGSLLRRTFAVALDIGFLVLLSLLIAWIWSYFAGRPNLDAALQYGWLSMALINPAYFWCCLLLSYIYMAPVKATKLRTIGYRITDLQVVNLRGLRPSIFQMAWRFILLAFGAIDLLLNLVWLWGDENRQTIRDKIAATYVISTDAVPIGTGSITRKNYFFLGWSWIFQEVERTQIDEDIKQVNAAGTSTARVPSGG